MKGYGGGTMAPGIIGLGTTTYVAAHNQIRAHASAYRYLFTYYKYRVFFFLWIQSRGCKSAILRSFEQFLYFLHSKIWAHFHFGTFDQ